MNEQRVLGPEFIYLFSTPHYGRWRRHQVLIASHEDLDEKFNPVRDRNPQ